MLDLTGTRIVRTDAEIECDVIDAWFRDRGAQLTLLAGNIDEASLCEAVSDASLILMCYTAITSNVIEAADKLQGIVKYGVGIDAIDIKAATERNIPVVNVPAYAEQTVAEGAFCLMLALQKKLLPIHQTMQQEGWIEPTRQWMANDVHGKCVAIVGAGRIGLAFARMAAQGFGARVIAYDPFVDAGTLHALNIEKVFDLHALLSQADIVSLHTVLNDATKTIIGPDEFTAMQRNPILINVSRGALIDETALLHALDTGQIKAAGLDVFTEEPLNCSDHSLAKLFHRENVIVTPHLTFFTEEAMQRLSIDTLARSEEILTGQTVTVHSTDPRLLAQQGSVNVNVK